LGKADQSVEALWIAVDALLSAFNADEWNKLPNYFGKPLMSPVAKGEQWGEIPSSTPRRDLIITPGPCSDAALPKFDQSPKRTSGPPICALVLRRAGLFPCENARLLSFLPLPFAQAHSSAF
jgi:hypothetical protein